jgi:hypothetical protein
MQPMKSIDSPITTSGAQADALCRAVSRPASICWPAKNSAITSGMGFVAGLVPSLRSISFMLSAPSGPAGTKTILGDASR